ncbi:FtsB family cell division protein [Rhodospirillaceae bacterium SYSU D60014]|uniref:FtsB family cell division protein n=1 Tax=Virgifigura deserti TaxID=2268457 RepID=UPI000E66D9DB
MVIIQELRQRARLIALPVVAACFVAYFLYHAVQGDRGIIAWIVLSQQIRDAEATLADIAAERRVLERRVELLRPESLDPDLLEERARAVLNFARPNELIILLDDDTSP